MATKFPCSRLALRALGKALNASAQIDAAQDAYGSVLEIYPDDIPSQVSMGLRK
jgi:predicted TPR repeat methyltransferase